VWPPECTEDDRVAGFCGTLDSLEGQFVSILATYASDEVITILPDGRLRLTVRMRRDDEKEPTAEGQANTVRGAGWTELPGSQLLHQAWERDQHDVTGVFRLYLDFSDGPLLADGTRATFIDGRIETAEPVVEPQRRPS
jgi:hypothetical protein